MQNIRENSFKIKWNFKLIRKLKNKLTSGYGGMIIQLLAAIFERIRNVQIKTFKSVFISFLSVAFSCILHLWFKRYRHHVVYNDITHDSVTCSLTLHHVNENRYVKCPVHFFHWNIFHSLRYEQTFLTNRIAGKQMNIKKIKLFIVNYNQRVRFPYPTWTMLMDFYNLLCLHCSRYE